MKISNLLVYLILALIVNTEGFDTEVSEFICVTLFCKLLGVNKFCCWLVLLRRGEKAVYFDSVYFVRRLFAS